MHTFEMKLDRAPTNKQTTRNKPYLPGSEFGQRYFYFNSSTSLKNIKHTVSVQHQSASLPLVKVLVIVKWKVKINNPSQSYSSSLGNKVSLLDHHDSEPNVIYP